ncbi:hypothetical protein Pen02_58060 [Plantactinospora endophytica]|uniref:Uncharacterized protein n=1 Tax=Plantactinospora endophytica TaxID=673535 RepID=A0ABQ4E822_9ACTN|nr:hypothetical protein Pen02_58060 [Plantactinospora endophytica]
MAGAVGVGVGTQPVGGRHGSARLGTVQLGTLPRTRNRSESSTAPPLRASALPSSVGRRAPMRVITNPALGDAGGPRGSRLAAGIFRANGGKRHYDHR